MAGFGLDENIFNILEELDALAEQREKFRKLNEQYEFFIRGFYNDTKPADEN